MMAAAMDMAKRLARKRRSGRARGPLESLRCLRPDYRV
jgi:hypothetical protein